MNANPLSATVRAPIVLAVRRRAGALRRWQQALARDGILLLTATTIPDAMAHLEGCPAVDLVLLDARLPGLARPAEALARMRALWPGARYRLLTTRLGAAAADLPLGAGAVTVREPAGAADLRRLVLDALAEPHRFRWPRP